MDHHDPEKRIADSARQPANASGGTDEELRRFPGQSRAPKPRSRRQRLGSVLMTLLTISFIAAWPAGLVGALLTWQYPIHSWVGQLCTSDQHIETYPTYGRSPGTGYRCVNPDGTTTDRIDAGAEANLLVGAVSYVPCWLTVFLVVRGRDIRAQRKLAAVGTPTVVTFGGSAPPPPGERPGF
jgi:hypothetical protein